MKLACELPDEHRRSLSTWTCTELARSLQYAGVVESISSSTVQRILASCKLKPWRSHYWMRSKAPRDEEFLRRTKVLCDLYTREIADWEAVLCLDEKTSIQPRPRLAPTRPARPGGVPVHVEHEYVRKGALNLLAAFNTRTGQVMGICRRRKRQVEFIELLELIDRQMPPEKTRIHLVCDNVSTHHGKLVRAWLAEHPRFLMHFPPVHCSWMNQIEQWFSILQRKRLKNADFTDLDALEHKITAFIVEWNWNAAPFKWTPKSFEKVIAKVEAEIRRAA